MAEGFGFRLPALTHWGGVRSVLGLVFRRNVAAPAGAASGAVASADPGTAAAVQLAGSQPNWLRVLAANELLQVVQAERALREIWRKSRFSRTVFDRDCLAAVHRYAEFVQLLPASEAHHHAHVGGLLTHTLEMLLAAMTWRNAHLLPENSPIEVIDAQRDEWTLVVFYAALLHDIGKVLTDLRITWRGKDVDPVRWMPLAGSLNDLAQGRAQAEYLVEFAPKVERDYLGHSRTAVMLLQRMASPSALALLARQPLAFEALNRYLAGADKDSLLARIVREADKASARRSLSSGSRARFATAQAVPLVDLLMQSLRSMLRAGTVLPLNRSGAAGWVYDGAIWFVAKRVADATREWIKKHEPEEVVPGETKNDRLFDTWQEYRCIDINPHTGQAVWYVTVHGRAADNDLAHHAGAKVEALSTDTAGMHPQPGDYHHTLTLLRFPLAKLFDDPAGYPSPMLGTIEVHAKGRTAAADDELQAEAAPEEGSEPASGAAIPEVLHTGDFPASRPVRETGLAARQPPAAATPSDRENPSQMGSGGNRSLKAPSFNRPRTETKPGAQRDAPPKAGAPRTPDAAADGHALKAAAARGPRVTPATDAPTGPTFPADVDDLLNDHEIPHGSMQESGPAAVRSDAGHFRADTGETKSPAAAMAFAVVRTPLDPSMDTPAATQAPTLLTRLSQVEAHAAVGRASPVPNPGTAATRPLLLDRSATTVSASGLSGPVLLEPRLPRRPESDDPSRKGAEPSALALAFLTWLQTGLASRELKYNETGAAVHFVPEGMALVSPLIFKLFAATRVDEAQLPEEALKVQREVVKAAWHQTGPNRMNILRYAVIARAGTESGKLAAVVLSEPGRFVQPVPPSNPVLKLL